MRGRTKDERPTTPVWRVAASDLEQKASRPLVRGRAQGLLRLVGRGASRALRLVERRAGRLSAALHGAWRLARHVIETRLRLVLPLAEPLLELCAGDVTSLGREEQAKRRTNGAPPYERAKSRHCALNLLFANPCPE